MSFHVVRHEHPTIFVVNRQTYETYRFTIGDDVALAHVAPPSDYCVFSSVGTRKPAGWRGRNPSVTV